MNFSKGFTLIEILVVIVILGILLSAIIVVINPIAQINKAKTAKAKTEIYYIKLAMQLYFDDFNDYPPTGLDFCSFPDTCAFGDTWSDIDSILYPKYLKKITKDPWGNDYYYDKNYIVGDTCNNSWSFICSAGPNGTVDSDTVSMLGYDICGKPGQVILDDICVYIENN